MVLKNRRPTWLERAALLTAALLLGGCGVTYLGQAANGQWAVMNARQPIGKLMAKASTSNNLKEQLLRAKRIRDFASAELGLPNNAAYRSYADIGRPYVVWNVVATPELSIQPLQWCFPIAGCVAYRGYFSEKAANSFAARLKARGHDVLTGGVPAYSTLGRIADPLLNTVTGYPELDLAALIFHELAHQVVYLPGDSSFNEAFATAVEEEGLVRYAATLGAPPLGQASALARWQARRVLRIEITQRFAATRAALHRQYTGNSTAAEKRASKAQLLGKLAAEIRAMERRDGRASGFGPWIDAGLNNAHLASMGTYYDQVPHFEVLLRDRCGGYLPCLYVRVAEEARARMAAHKKKGPAKAGP
jgi:predicted aminopeptidase